MLASCAEDLAGAPRCRQAGKALLVARDQEESPAGADVALGATGAAPIHAVDDDSRRRWAEARAKAIAWSVEVASDPRVIYLDTETTGFGPRAEIVDIALVSAAGQVIFESLVRPTRRIPRDVTAIHGITDADVANAPVLGGPLPGRAAAARRRRIVVYNVTFDRQMVTQACEPIRPRHAGGGLGIAPCGATPAFSGTGTQTSGGTGSESWSAPW